MTERTKRDEIALVTWKALLEATQATTMDGQNIASPKEYAAGAYDFADAFLAERAKEQK